MSARRYPRKAALHALELRRQGFSILQIRDHIVSEFPEIKDRILATASEGIDQVRYWTRSISSSAISGNNSIQPGDNEDLGILEHFPLRLSGDKFDRLEQDIPKLLTEKREELKKIQAQIIKLEKMNEALELEDEISLAACNN